MVPVAILIIFSVIFLYAFLHLIWLKACQYKQIPIFYSVVMSSSYLLFFLSAILIRSASVIFTVIIILTVLILQSVYAIKMKNGKALRATALLYIFNSLLGALEVLASGHASFISMGFIILALLALPGLFFLFYASRFSGI